MHFKTTVKPVYQSWEREREKKGVWLVWIFGFLVGVWWLSGRFFLVLLLNTQVFCFCPVIIFWVSLLRKKKVEFSDLQDLPELRGMSNTTVQETSWELEPLSLTQSSFLHTAWVRKKLAVGRWLFSPSKKKKKKKKDLSLPWAQPDFLQYRKMVGRKMVDLRHLGQIWVAQSGGRPQGIWKSAALYMKPGWRCERLFRFIFRRRALEGSCFSRASCMWRSNYMYTSYITTRSLYYQMISSGVRSPQ